MRLEVRQNQLLLLNLQNLQCMLMTIDITTKDTQEDQLMLDSNIQHHLQLIQIHNIKLPKHLEQPTPDINLCQQQVKSGSNMLDINIIQQLLPINQMLILLHSMHRKVPINHHRTVNKLPQRVDNITTRQPLRMECTIQQTLEWECINITQQQRSINLKLQKTEGITPKHLSKTIKPQLLEWTLIFILMATIMINLQFHSTLHQSEPQMLHLVCMKMLLHYLLQ